MVMRVNLKGSKFLVWNGQNKSNAYTYFRMLSVMFKNAELDFAYCAHVSNLYNSSVQYFS